ncbi:MAG: hypothetical protein NVSMB8_14610 [Candidatus Limnocylindrales bacterium]
MKLRAWLDRTPAASVALALMRDATGREAPLEPLRPTRPAALPDRVIAFWALQAGIGTSTIAALAAQRSAAAGHPGVLIDLDRWAPSLALRAETGGATVEDALLHPGDEGSLVSRWGGTAFLPGSKDLNRSFDGRRIGGLVRALAAGRPAVLELGAGADGLDPAIVETLDRLCVVAGTRTAQLQAAFCAVPLLRGLRVPIGLVVVGAEQTDAARIADRLPWPLLAAVPADPFLAEDRFAARAPTLRAVDALIRAIG